MRIETRTDRDISKLTVAFCKFQRAYKLTLYLLLPIRPTYFFYVATVFHFIVITLLNNAC